jgi:hypothetical protein
MGKLHEVFDPVFPHLGGNAAVVNPHTHCPDSWSYIVNKYNIKSVLDVGSGYGYTAKWFAEQGLNAIAIEGLQKNVDNAVHPTIRVDLTESAYTADVDLVNCIEVVEHVEERFLENLLTTLCCGKYIFMTHGLPKQRGHHHVNNQPTSYWITHLARKGFHLSVEDSKKIKELSGTATHVAQTGMLFIKR